ncbi:IS5/IS1182 family transposase, partial [Sporosarcina sp. E16_3]|nr:IS5/IS1182 family transposase [Sporosarcina sp. E16_3]
MPIIRQVSLFNMQVLSLNYSAMIYSLIIRITERIPFIKDLVKRLSTDLRF